MQLLAQSDLAQSLEGWMVRYATLILQVGNCQIVVHTARFLFFDNSSLELTVCTAACLLRTAIVTTVFITCCRQFCKFLLSIFRLKVIQLQSELHFIVNVIYRQLKSVAMHTDAPSRQLTDTRSRADSVQQTGLPERPPLLGVGLRHSRAQHCGAVWLFLICFIT